MTKHQESTEDIKTFVIYAIEFHDGMIVSAEVLVGAENDVAIRVKELNEQRKDWTCDTYEYIEAI